MSSRSKFLFLASFCSALVLLLCSAQNAFAAEPSVVTYSYSNQTVPPAALVRPGDLTLSDILPLKKKSVGKDVPQASTPIEKTAVAAPFLTAKPQQSTSGVMLLQGLKTSLQKSGEDASAVIRPPRMPTTFLVEKTANGGGSPLTGVAAVSLPRKEGALMLSEAEQSSLEQPSVETYSYVAGREPRSLNIPREDVQVTGRKEAIEPVVPQGALVISSSSSAAGATAKVEGGLAAQVLGSSSLAGVTAPQPMPVLSMKDTADASGGARVEGGCGVANGLAASAPPREDLCQSGMATAVEGAGPWLWSCRGQGGGVTVSCAAPLALNLSKPMSSPVFVGEMAVRKRLDGSCGAAAQVPTDQRPEGELCLEGIASAVSGSGPWTWACSGLNGGKAAACQTGIRANGSCGAAHGNNFNEMPMTELCATGLASAVTGAGPWNWTCSGVNGGTASNCMAQAYMAGVCGEASILGHKETPKSALCSVGVATAVEGAGPWTWGCSGVNGGPSVNCRAGISVSGVCGSANGASFAEAPVSDLCQNGRATRVLSAGMQAWSWSCLGEAQGDSVSCTAVRGVGAHGQRAPMASLDTNKARQRMEQQEEPIDSASACGDAVMAILSKPTSGLCRIGEAGDVDGEGPWRWVCRTANGKTTQCTTATPVSDMAAQQSKDAQMQAAGEVISAATGVAAGQPIQSPAASPQQVPVCGDAHGQGALQQPVENLCLQGKASAVKGKGPWTWACALGKSKAVCKTPLMIDAVCGRSNGSIQMGAPTQGLCNAGQASAVQGAGPWMWSCSGSGGGVTVSCSAGAQSQTKVDGLCGAASAVATLKAPDANLCDSGMPSRVFGDGPWTWTCSGINGGLASTCQSEKVMAAPPPPPAAAVDAVCGAANGRVYAVQPMDSLCAAGTETMVSGEGPWNWSCLGANGGMTVSCTALLQPPAPIVGVCGTASGVPTNKKPRSGLCSAGISSAVSGQGPWTWSCSGTNGGGAVACVAPSTESASGVPSLVTPSNDVETPDSPSKLGKRSSLITPQLPSGPLAPTKTGTQPLLPTDMPAPKAMSSALDQINAEGAVLPLPPPLRDTTLPSAGYKGGGETIAGNRFVLDDSLSMISFEEGSGNIPADMVGRLDQLAGTLSSHGNVRIMLTAYADSAKSTPREARRLSLTRALAVRDYLVTKGVSSARLDVRARGANAKSGDLDRVDVTVN